MSNEKMEVPVMVARGVPQLLKIFCLAGATVGLYYSLVLDSMLSLGGWVLVFALMFAYHVVERAAVSYHNQYELLKSLLIIRELQGEGTTEVEGSLTKDEGKDGNGTETSTNGE